MEKYKDLIKKAAQFVEKQKGAWDHSRWQAFLSDTEKIGGTMNEEMQRYLGAVTESMKKFYEHTAGTRKKMTGTVSDQVARFVDKTKGKWEHLEWEKFVKDIQKKGTDITESNRAHLGGILEAAKKFYHSLPRTIQREASEAEVIKAPEALEVPTEPQEKTVRKPTKPAAKKVTKPKTPKKEGTPSKTTSTKKARPEKSKGTRVTKSAKTAKTTSPKKKAAAEGKAKTTAAKTTSPKKQTAKKTTSTKPAAKGAVKGKGASAGKKK